MPKPSHREKLLQVGMQVVHERGFRGASVRDIVQAAGVPQGSFTNHFASKEAFGLEVVERYAAQADTAMRQTLRNEHLPPLQRLRAFIERSKTGFAEDGLRNGCLLGNFSAEANDCGEPLRGRVVAALADMQDALAFCLRAAVSGGELAPSTDCDGTAEFVLAALQGATLLAKAQRSPRPLERFEDVLFERVLERATPVR
ncbi:MAG TPA: TetR family transcriptional regulator C-terminal domain-containing protein [Burkholderiaceae bacterium]